ncbi:hypothetical protein PENTCL1PPCAC_21299, partial [Pristionchus entomophagus]
QMSAFLAVNSATNQTVWIPFFIRFALLPEAMKPFYAVFVALETLGHIFSIVACSFCIYVYFKVQALHFNLAQTILIEYYIGLPFMLLRFPLILMETGIINYESMADDQIVIISLIRTWLFIDLYNFEVNIAIERYFALRYVRTYETDRRRYISLCIIAANAVYSLILSYLLTFNYIHGFVYIALTCVVSNISFLMFLSITKKNDRIQAHLVQFRRNDGSYTVSYRWQLHDNLRSARELRVLMIGINGVISFILPVLFVPALIFDNDPSKSEILEAAKLVYEVLSAYVFGCSYLFATFIIKRHRDFVFGISAVEEFSVAFEHTRTENRVVVDTESHFSKLHGDWTVELAKNRGDRLEIVI